MLDIIDAYQIVNPAIFMGRDKIFNRLVDFELHCLPNHCLSFYYIEHLKCEICNEYARFVQICARGSQALIIPDLIK